MSELNISSLNTSYFYNQNRIISASFPINVDHVFIITFYERECTPSILRYCWDPYYVKVDAI